MTRTPRPTNTPRFTDTPSAPESGSPNHPVKIGEPLFLTRNNSQDYGLEIYKVIRGAEAWQRIHDANQFNDPPSAGREYIMVLAGVVYDEKSPGILEMNQYQFKAVSDGQIIDDFKSVVAPEPRFDLKLLPGGKGGGWIVKEVYVGDANPLLLYGSKPDGSGGFYFSLTEVLPGYKPPQ